MKRRDADEVSAGVYKVHDQGFRHENTGIDPDKLLEEAKDWARKSKVEPQMKQTGKNGAIFDWLAMLEDTEFTGQIYQIALGHLKSDTADFEPAWQKFLLEFQQGATQSPAQNTSGLNVKLWFLEMLLKQFPPLSALRTDPRVIDLVLAGCRMVGDKVVHPRFGECEITRRSIGDRFGVLYTIKAADGSLVSFEFFD